MRVTISLLMLSLLAGCATEAEEGFDSSSEPLVITSACRLRGLGKLLNGDWVGGDIWGDGVAVFGQWTHVGLHSVVVDPNWLVCRINGSEIADFSGPATFDGAGGYTFRAQVQDLGSGPWDFFTLTATRYYRPDRWVDGYLDLRRHRLALFPTKLPVTVGSAGAGGRAEISFLRHVYLDVVTCTYRGTVDGIYVFRDCTGERLGSPPAAGGDLIDVEWVKLHIRSGNPVSPSPSAAQTTVSFELPVVATRQDFYRALVFDNTTGDQVLTSEGELSVGDLDITMDFQP